MAVDPALQFRVGHAGAETRRAEEGARSGLFAQGLPCAARAAAAGSAERNNRDAGEVMALHKGAHNARGLSPPDGITEVESRDAVEGNVVCNLRTGVGRVLLHGGPGRAVIVVQILRRVGLGRNEVHKLRAGEGRDLLGDALCGAGAGKDNKMEINNLLDEYHCSLL